MTLLDQPQLQSAPKIPTPTGQPASQGSRQPSQPKFQNVGQVERKASVAAGAVLTLLGLSRRSVPGLLVAGIGGALAYRGATGHCAAYESLGVDTAHGGREKKSPEEELAENGIHVEQACLINRSPEDLYRFWRNFENLPRIMTHLRSVRVLDDRRSSWVVDAPAILGGKAEWQAEVIRDEPNSLIAWRSLPGSSVDTTGEIRFAKAMGDRGTEVHVSMEYLPPAGRLGHWIATMFGKAPRRQMRDDLRNFKSLMETGDILTTVGQPKGNCLGGGKRATN